MLIKELTKELDTKAMSAVSGGKEPVGRPTHIDALNNVITFKDGSQYSMDLLGNFHPL
jgi:bacteriocin-like protein